jgi:hypothetical protein
MASIGASTTGNGARRRRIASLVLTAFKVPAARVDGQVTVAGGAGTSAGDQQSVRHGGACSDVSIFPSAVSC